MTLSRYRFRLSPMGRRLVWAILVVGAAIGLLIGLWALQLHLRMDPLADVRAYYDAGARLNAGLPLYEQAATTNEAAFYRYPPLLAILFRPWRSSRTRSPPSSGRPLLLAPRF